MLHASTDHYAHTESTTPFKKGGHLFGHRSFHEWTNGEGEAAAKVPPPLLLSAGESLSVCPN